MVVRIESSTVKKPKIRARYVSLWIYISTAFSVIIYWVATGQVDEYTQTPKNETDVCYKKETNWAFPYVLSMMWSLIGTITGVALDRLILVIDERHYRKLRYGGSWKNMISACLSGISRRSVGTALFFAIIMIAILTIISGKSWIDVNSVISLLSGIGIGPLIMQMLCVTESKVYIAKIIEKKQAFPAHTLAWSYYLTDLRICITQFSQLIGKNGRNYELFENKLLLLMPINFYTEDIDKLMKYDETIKKGDYTNDKPFSVWSLKVSLLERSYAVHYIKGPLAALNLMKKDNNVKSVTSDNWVQQVELLYQTLYKILNENEDDPEVKNNAFLVPIKLETKEKPGTLNRNELTKCIMETIEPSRVLV